MIRPEIMRQIQEAIDYFKVVNDKILKDEKASYLSVEVHEFKLNCDVVLRREGVIKGKGNNSKASVIIPVTEDGTVILTIQPRCFTRLTVGVDFPGGLVDEGEDFKTAAKRELLEETGYYSDELIELGSYYPEDSLGPSFNTGFLALNCKKVKEQSLDPGELIRYVEVSIEELFELQKMGYINGGGSQFLLSEAKPYLYEFLNKKSNVAESTIQDNSTGEIESIRVR